MMSELEKFVVDQLSARLAKDGSRNRVVRYTECSWGGYDYNTARIEGATYDQILDSIDAALEDLLSHFSIRGRENDQTLGIGIERVIDREQDYFIECRITLYHGAVMGGDDLVPGLIDAQNRRHG